MSMFCSLTSISTLPTACTASVWNSTPRSRQMAPISGIGWMVPISLLAYMIETRAVSGRMASATSAGSTRPSGLHRQVGHLKALPSPALGGVEDGVVLKHGGDEVVFPLFGQGRPRPP